MVLHLNQLHARGDDAVDIKDPAQSYIRYKRASMVHTGMLVPIGCGQVSAKGGKIS